jgi:hypothetical protein
MHERRLCRINNRSDPMEIKHKITNKVLLNIEGGSLQGADSSVDTHYGSRNRTQRICQLPNVQGTSEASGVHGHPRALHHMGSLRCWRCHSWLHHCLLHLWICCWSDCSCCFSLHWCRTYLLQTEERSAHKERRPRCVYLRLFTKNVIFIECS